MIDHFSAFSKKLVRLKPLFFAATVAATVAFGYVMLFAENAGQDVYLIPSIVVVLWSLVCSLLLSIFPYVPPMPAKQQPLRARLKIRLARSGYHLVSWLFCALSVSAAWITIKLLSVWYADFT